MPSRWKLKSEDRFERNFKFYNWYFIIILIHIKRSLLFKVILFSVNSSEIIAVELYIFLSRLILNLVIFRKNINIWPMLLLPAVSRWQISIRFKNNARHRVKSPPFCFVDFNKFQIPYGIYDMSVKSKFDPVKIKTRFEFVNWALAASLDLEQGLLNILIEYIPLHYITYRSITICSV